MKPNFFSDFFVNSEKDPVLKQAGKQAAIAGINVFNDVMDGRNLTDALLDRYACSINVHSTELVY